MSGRKSKDPYAERRAYKRFFFSAEEGLVARVAVVDTPLLPMDALILNASRGGLGLALAREFDNGLRKGAPLALVAISASRSGHPRTVTPEHPVPMTLRWLVAAEYLNHVGFGCEFNTLDDNTYDRIQAFIETVVPGRFADA